MEPRVFEVFNHFLPSCEVRRELSKATTLKFKGAIGDAFFLNMLRTAPATTVYLDSVPDPMRVLGALGPRVTEVHMTAYPCTKTAFTLPNTVKCFVGYGLIIDQLPRVERVVLDNCIINQASPGPSDALLLHRCHFVTPPKVLAPTITQLSLRACHLSWDIIAHLVKDRALVLIDVLYNGLTPDALIELLKIPTLVSVAAGWDAVVPDKDYSLCLNRLLNCMKPPGLQRLEVGAFMHAADKERLKQMNA